MKKIYVGNLPFSATESQVKEMFGKHGNVQSVALINFRFGVFADCGHFSSNLRAIFSAAFIAFSNRTLIAAGHSC